MEAFSNRLRELRTEKDLNQAEVAAIAGVSVQSYSAYETGREPKYEILCKLASYFNVSTDYLLGISPYRKGENALAINELGLSEKAIQTIKKFRDDDDRGALIALDTVLSVNESIKNGTFANFLGSIYEINRMDDDIVRHTRHGDISEKAVYRQLIEEMVDVLIMEIGRNADLDLED